MFFRCLNAPGEIELKLALNHEKIVKLMTEDESYEDEDNSEEENEENNSDVHEELKSDNDGKIEDSSRDDMIGWGVENNGDEDEYKCGSDKLVGYSN